MAGKYFQPDTTESDSNFYNVLIQSIKQTMKVKEVPMTVWLMEFRKN